MSETLDSNFSTEIRLLESALWEKTYFYGGKRVASFISEDRDRLQGVDYFLQPIHFLTEQGAGSLTLFQSDAFFYQILAYCIQELHKIGVLKDLHNSYRVETRINNESGKIFQSVIPLSGVEYFGAQKENKDSSGLIDRITVMERSLISVSESIGYSPEFLKILVPKHSLSLLELAMTYATNYHKSVFGTGNIQALDETFEELLYFGQKDSIGFFLNVDSPKNVWVKEFFQAGAMSPPLKHSLVHESAQSVARSVKNDTHLLLPIARFFSCIEEYLATKKDSR